MSVYAGAQGSQKRASDLLERVTGSCELDSMGAGNSPWVLWKSSKSSYPLNHLSSPQWHTVNSVPVARW